MGILSDIVSGKRNSLFARYMRQELFNSVVFTSSLLALNESKKLWDWDDFEAWIDGSPQFEKIIREYEGMFDNDGDLRAHIYQGTSRILGVVICSFELDDDATESDKEKVFDSGNHRADQIEKLEEIINLSNKIKPDGSKIVNQAVFLGESHSNPKIRVQTCENDFIAYWKMTD